MPTVPHHSTRTIPPHQSIPNYSLFLMIVQQKLPSLAGICSRVPNRQEWIIRVRSSDSCECPLSSKLMTPKEWLVPSRLVTRHAHGVPIAGSP